MPPLLKHIVGKEVVGELIDERGFARAFAADNGNGFAIFTSGSGMDMLPVMHGTLMNGFAVVFLMQGQGDKLIGGEQRSPTVAFVGNENRVFRYA